MIKHIVMWKLKDFAEKNGKVVNAKIIKDSLENLKALIPKIKFLEVGLNENKSDKAYDIVLYSEFNSLEDLNVYLKHPELIKVQGFISRVKEDRLVVDYEI